MRWLVVAVLAGCGFEVSPGVASDAPRAIDAAIDAPADAPGPPIVLVQKASNFVTNSNTVDCTFAAPHTAGNATIVVVSWFSSAGEVQTVSDTDGNSYTSTNITIAGMYSMRIYYAASLVPASTTNRVFARFFTNVAFPKLRILEYAGLGPVPFERGASSNGNGALATSGAITTTTPHALLFAPNVINGVSSAIAPFVMVDSSDGDLVETREVQVPGTYTATASLGLPNDWVMMIAAFRGR